MKDEDHNDRVVQAQMGSKWLLGRWLISKFDSETTNYRRHIFILRLVLSVKNSLYLCSSVERGGL